MKIVLVALLILQLIRELYAICPADRQYLYNSICYSECPWSPPIKTYLDTQTGTCVTGNSFFYISLHRNHLFCRRFHQDMHSM